MDDKFNTAAGWVLFAGIIALGFSILSGKYFHADKPERPETLGYVIEGVELVTDGGAPEMSIAQAMNMMSLDEQIAAGERIFNRCASCHTVEQGGADGIGPNLYAVMGAGIGNHVPGFAYSSALQGKGGNWDWDAMNEWLKNPRGFADGTTMSFAGLNKIEDRAAVAIYLNSYGSNLAIPEYVEALAEDAAEDQAEAAEVSEELAEDAAPVE